MNRGIVALFVVLLLAPAVLFSGTAGKISGRVVDSQTGEVLPGVNVFLEGTAIGSATDSDGYYYILNIPAGSYTLTASFVGYQRIVVQDFIVSADFTSTQNFSMVSEALVGEEIVVTAERPLIQKDRTSSISITTAEDIRHLPVRGHEEIIALQAGVVLYENNGVNQQDTYHFRGGRGHETAIYVDGFIQNSPLTGLATTTINNNAIDEIIIFNNGFNAEYGRNMSGIVNVITKGGSEEYHGSVELESDKPSGDWVGSHSYGYNVWNLAFGGPLLPTFNKVRFYVSYEGRNIDDRSPSHFWDGKKPQNNNGNWSDGWEGTALQWKVSALPSNWLRLDVNGLYSDDTKWGFQTPYRYNLDHIQRREDTNSNIGVKATVTINAKAYFDVGLHFYSNAHKHGDDTHWDKHKTAPGNMYGQRIGNWTSIAGDPYLGNRYDPGRVYVSPGASRDNWVEHESSYIGTRANFVYQHNVNHQFKFGWQTEWHSLRWHWFATPATGPFIVDTYGYDLTGNKDDNFNNGLDGVKEPRTYGFYFQDKIEYEGMIVNAGVRLDYLDSNTRTIADLNDVLGRTSNDPSNDPSKIDGSDFVKNNTYTKVSPRLGVSFPIRETTVLHFNYGMFFQQPNLQDLYVGYRFLERLASGTTTIQVQASNPNLKPEETTAYEIGINQSLNDYVRLAVTGYYKDVKNLINMELVKATEGTGATALNLNWNMDYGTIKGIDIVVEMRRWQNTALKLSYGLSYATGTGSEPDGNFNHTWLGFEDAKVTAPLDFDQRHTLSAMVDYTTTSDANPLWRDMFFNVLLRANSGQPYTPDLIHNSRALGAVPADTPSGDTNSRYGPWQFRVDAKIERRISLADKFNFSVYLKVLNLLNRENPLDVFSATGSPYDDGYLQSSAGQFLANSFGNLYGGKEEFVRRYKERLQVPASWGIPRVVRFGVIFDF